jgi:excisionase family DNA binding protein
MHVFTHKELKLAEEARRRAYKARREQERREKDAETARRARALDVMRLPNYFTPKEAAAILGVTPKCIREWVQKGKIKAGRFVERGHMRILPAEVDRLRATYLRQDNPREEAGENAAASL